MLRSCTKLLTPEEKINVNGWLNLSVLVLDAGKVDEEEKRKAEEELRALKNKLDQMEQMKEFPQLKIEFNELTTSMIKVIDEIGAQKDKEIHMDKLKVLKAEGYEAIENGAATENTVELTSRRRGRLPHAPHLRPERIMLFRLRPGFHIGWGRTWGSLATVTIG